MLYATIFLTGAIIMIVELVGIRLFTPYFGSTMNVVTGIISAVLTAMGFGYFIGGKIADKNPRLSILTLLLFCASLLLLITFTWSEKMLIMLSANKQFHSLFVVIASLGILGPFSLLLAAISPYAVKLLLHTIKSSGTTAGIAYAIGTFGSISGTLLSGYALIPTLPLNWIIFYTSAFLFLWSVVLAVRAKMTIKLICFGVLMFLLFGYIYLVTRKRADTLITVESQYGNIQVIQGFIKENGEEKFGRFIMVNNRCCQSGMDLKKPNDLYFKYLDYFAWGASLVPSASSYLIVGGGGYSYPKHIVANVPDAIVDVVEIDPVMTAIAKQYFFVPESPRLKTYFEDGRIYLNTNDKKYDVIAMNATHDYSVPFALVTQEAIYKIKNSLSDKGIVMTNIASGITGSKSKLFASVYKTYTSVFKNVYAFKVYSTPDSEIQTIVLIASESDLRLTNRHEYITTQIEPSKNIEAILLTDNFAPVERMLLP